MEKKPEFVNIIWIAKFKPITATKRKKLKKCYPNEVHKRGQYNSSQYKYLESIWSMDESSAIAFLDVQILLNIIYKK